MKISFNWLRHYLDIELMPDKVAEYLTGCGLEVEGMELFQSVKGGLKGVVIGEVLTCEKHPNSDHLSLTTVNIGSGDPLKIVCGASNVTTGQKVAVATLGSTLYFNDKELTLQRTKIRGELSEGMICAEDELGLGTSHSGILVLDPNVPVGTPAAKYFNVVEDYVFTIGLTPNRTDATSHLGVARDLIAVINNFGRKEGTRKEYLKLQIPDVSNFQVNHDRHHVKVIIEEPLACPRYSGLTISGITVKDSPDWLKNSLMAVGIRPINNIVDVTNFILMELGHPLHAFDCEQITGDTVIVKKYPAETKFITLDGVERSLTSNDLMICNSIEPMCIAGVYGGIKSGVTEKTTRIFLESAYFDPVHIRKTSRYHGLQTDASFRFERGADYDITVFALKRAALLIQKLAGGEVSSEIVDVYPNPIANPVVDLTFAHLDRLIGQSIDHGVVRNILSDLGIEILDNSPNGSGEPESKKRIRVRIPGNRADVTREADVIEEILRVYGYNNIKLPEELRTSISFSTKPEPEKIQNQISDFLSAHGFHEIMNNSLTRPGYYETEEPRLPASGPVKILNPMSHDLEVMRQSLLHGAMESMMYNVNRKLADLWLYEFGAIYSDLGTGILSGFREEQHLALLMTGRLQSENWNTSDQPVDFFVLKGFVEAILKKLRIDPGICVVEPAQSQCIPDGFRYMAKGKELLSMGALGKPILKLFDCRQSVLYAEINWDLLLTLLPIKENQFKDLPKFPEVRRDLALLVDESVTFEQIKKIAYQAERKLLKQVGLFDVYEGEKLTVGKKSYALSFFLQDEEKTLTEKEIEKSMDRLVKAFTTNLHAQIR
ncbi:MAG: phenylalanine--tRNA ligase subunit beta [Bacteroidales bacterium]|nr:phenylalanine--tRNA ligase subunit beta [Bacteroidales bacterium]MDD4602286.1 phenylalanine--tRNA ligase subunit beta [Bacteroidales bacterium]